jgi:hypothetical protein
MRELASEQLSRSLAPGTIAPRLAMVRRFVSPATAMRHATLAGADFLAYAATRTISPNLATE